ncbi:MAG: hypothetical protein DMF68_01130 [Acidobacteria bacterium]|nr:MAG: hypothetical protein DMF68_01130 [Acidobacteriota bacterium]
MKENIEPLCATDAAGQTKSSKSIFVLLAIISAQYCLAFITSPLIARYLGPDGRGRFTFFLSVTQWTIIIFGLGSPQAITYLVASRRFPGSKAFSVALTVLITLAGAISILTLALFFLWPTALNNLARSEVALLAVCSFGQ